ncbi:MAG TPA: hypothetical protein VGB83_04325 [Actinomycetota bacterium]
MVPVKARASALAGAAIAAALLVAMLAIPQTGRAAAALCGTTTLAGRVEAAPDGTLRCGPGEQLAVRDDLAKADPSRASTRRPLLSFFTAADLQLQDEESPLRAEYLAQCGSPPDVTPFRAYETLLPALLNAHAEAMSSLASSPAGSPVLRKNYDFAMMLGSGAANKHYNEVRWYLDLLDGGLLDPDSGADGYEGVQRSDPQAAQPGLATTAGSLLELGNEPFAAAGLRAGPAPLSWFSVIGNNDVKVFGTAPDDNDAWRQFADTYATGSVKLGDGGGEITRKNCREGGSTDRDFYTDQATRPGAAMIVTADDDRRLVDRFDWISEHFTTRGLPSGHGFDRTRCRDAGGAVLGRACYTWDQDPFHFVALDTTPPEGASGGNLDPAQFAWLERDLKANAGTYYSETGTKKRTGNAGKIVIVAMHHSFDTLDNQAPPPDGSPVLGEELNALLSRFPNVVLVLSGHDGQNRITPHTSEVFHTSFWEVETAALTDWPSQTRSIEIADNGDGTLSIFSVMVDAAVPPDARAMSWTADDPTDERRAGGARRINENWLASAARELSYVDPSKPEGAAGRSIDRNVELLVPNPLGVTGGGSVLPPVPIPVPPPIPGFTFPTPTPPACGFPGGIPCPQTTLPGDTFPPPVDSLPLNHNTGPGLAVLPTSDGGWGGRGAIALLVSLAGALWLVRARVHRWMVGI